MKKYTVLICVVAVSALFGMCRKADRFTDADYDERLSGGAATVFDETSKALGHELPGLSERNSRVHAQGDAAFGQTFVTDPAPRFGGLGPVYNNVSCIACHHNDGKGTPTAGTATSSLLVRVSTGLKDPHGGPGPVDGYGNQIQDIAIHGVPAEAKVMISYSDKMVTYPDGKTVTLRAPAYTLTNSYIPLAGHSLSPRLAPPVFGLGLLENIPEATILSFEQQNRQNADAIRGHANHVYNPQNGLMAIGRFGLKANTANIFVQVASAYLQDMGITSSLFPLESCNGQTQMSAVINPGKPNLPDSTLNQVVFYVRSLSVPARRDVADRTVLRGQQLFTQLRCSGCHIPTLRTGVDLAFPQLSNQRIHPYTDLLLHDMGADLADGYIDYEATGNEWKTPALWGIGLYEKTNGTAYYLHDGRARTTEEAILWHGGEAKASRDQFMQLSEADRQALLRFLKSL